MKVRGEERRKKEGGENRKWSREPKEGGGYRGRSHSVITHSLKRAAGCSHLLTGEEKKHPASPPPRAPL